MQLAVAEPPEPTARQLEARLNGLREDFHRHGLALHAVSLKVGANEGDCLMLRARTNPHALDSRIATNLVSTLEVLRLMQDKIRLLEAAAIQNNVNIETVQADMEQERINNRNNYVTASHLERTFATQKDFVDLKAITQKMYEKIFSPAFLRLLHIKGELQTAIKEWMTPILFRMQEVADNYNTLVEKVDEVQHNVEALAPALHHLPMSDVPNLLCTEETLSDLGGDWE